MVRSGDVSSAQRPLLYLARYRIGRSYCGPLRNHNGRRAVVFLHAADILDTPQVFIKPTPTGDPVGGTVTLQKYGVGFSGLFGRGIGLKNLGLDTGDFRAYTRGEW